MSIEGLDDDHVNTTGVIDGNQILVRFLIMYWQVVAINI